VIAITKNIKFVITIFVLLVILISFLFYISPLRRPHGGGSYLRGVSIGYNNYKSTGIDLYTNLGLNESTASKLSGTSLVLSIRETTTNRSEYLDYIISNHHIILASGKDLFIEKPILNYSYHLSFQFLINSTDPEVKNVNVIGLNNYFNLSFIITRDMKIKIKLDPDFLSLTDKIEERNGNGYVWFIGTPQFNGGHVYQISPNIISYD